MKELGITKGELEAKKILSNIIHREEPETSLEEIMEAINEKEDKYKEPWIEAALEAMSEYSNKKNSELLERYNEAIEAVNVVLNMKNPYNREKQYQQWAAAENILDNIIRDKKFQQTISKVKP